jgi:hypothetical protein
MNCKINYGIIAKTQQHSAPNVWLFVSLPTHLSTEKSENPKEPKEGWC